jgi:ParB family chromosome partitioning protein
MTESTDTTTVKTNRKIAFEIYPEDVCIIGLDTDDGPEHPLWDERVALPVNQAMVDNMLLRGWTHGAVELRKNKADKRYEVVVGRQRVKAARTANEQGTDGYERLKVVAFMNDVEDNDAMGLVISENEQRTDDNPMAKADKLKRFMMQGKTIAEAALVFGVSKQTIKLWAKAHKLIGPVQDAVRSGKISFNGALGLADLSEDKQQEALDALPEDGEGQDGNVTKKQIKKLKEVV